MTLIGRLPSSLTTSSGGGRSQPGGGGDSVGGANGVRSRCTCVFIRFCCSLDSDSWRVEMAGDEILLAGQARGKFTSYPGESGYEAGGKIALYPG